MKLYEMAFYSTGAILELGTNEGLSTWIMAQAVVDLGYPKKILTVEFMPNLVELARKHLDKYTKVIDFVCADAMAFCDDLVCKGQSFYFSFIDHSHQYADMLKTNESLKQLIQPGGFALFHDFTDARNTENRAADDPATVNMASPLPASMPSLMVPSNIGVPMVLPGFFGGQATNTN